MRVRRQFPRSEQPQQRDPPFRYTDPHYRALRDLEKQFQDLVILAFPCNQFAAEEPLPAIDVARNVRRTYGVEFPIMEKINVNGPHTHPIYKFLKGRTQSPDISWNFAAYFLVSKSGTVSAHPGGDVLPTQLSDLIASES